MKLFLFCIPLCVAIGAVLAQEKQAQPMPKAPVPRRVEQPPAKQAQPSPMQPVKQPAEKPGTNVNVDVRAKSRVQVLQSSALPKQPKPNPTPGPKPEVPPHKDHKWHWHSGHHHWVMLPSNAYQQVVLPHTFVLPAQVQVYQANVGAGDCSLSCPYCGNALRIQVSQ